MKHIKLMRVSKEDGQSFGPIIVNTDRIASVHTCERPEGATVTLVRMNDGKAFFLVKETPDEIYQMIRRECNSEWKRFFAEDEDDGR